MFKWVSFVIHSDPSISNPNWSESPFFQKYMVPKTYFRKCIIPKNMSPQPFTDRFDWAVVAICSDLKRKIILSIGNQGVFSMWVLFMVCSIFVKPIQPTQFPFSFHSVAFTTGTDQSPIQMSHSFLWTTAFQQYIHRGIHGHNNSLNVRSKWRVDNG